MANTQSKDDSLRELNYKLVAEIDKLRKENAEIPELKKKCTEIETENIELKAENMKIKADNAKDEFSSLQLISDLSTVNSNNIPVSSEVKTIDEFQDQKEKERNLISVISKSPEQNHEPDEIEPIKSQYIEQGLIKELLNSNRQHEEILAWYNYSDNFENRVIEICHELGVTDKTARTQLYKEMLKNLPGITSGNLRMKTLRPKKIQMLFGENGVGIDKIKQVTYSIYAISTLTNSQIQNVIKNVTSAKPLSETSMNHENQTSAEIKAEVNASTEETESRVSDSANSETEICMPPISQVNISNKFRLPISILPNNPEEKRKHVIKMVLERFTNLSFKCSSKYTDHFNCTETCPVCNKEHKDDNVSGEWGSGDYYGEETYRLYCRKVYQNGIQMVTVKKKNIKEKQKDHINKVLKQYPGISLSCSTNSNDIYHCNTSKSSCPSCNLNHKENIVGQYERGSYNIRCMFNYTGGIDVTA
ncbi:22839_t:CDS:2 [Cetraspora pellucida]|uniref:22839_t:CDS:1 n=1 Tax=Cetraspora pellucida TaxID=1433469 RepID=A0A9N9IQC1_9GLOM|nr:22839_t:CDS:2 [Cetraspora pellucida]